MGSVVTGEKVVRGKGLEGGWAKLTDGVGILPRWREGEGEGGVMLMGGVSRRTGGTAGGGFTNLKKKQKEPIHLHSLAITLTTARGLRDVDQRLCLHLKVVVPHRRPHLRDLVRRKLQNRTTSLLLLLFPSDDRMHRRPQRRNLQVIPRPPGRVRNSDDIVPRRRQRFFGHQLQFLYRRSYRG